MSMFNRVKTFLFRDQTGDEWVTREMPGGNLSLYNPKKSAYGNEAKISKSTKIDKEGISYELLQPIEPRYVCASDGNQYEPESLILTADGHVVQGIYKYSPY